MSDSEDELGQLLSGRNGRAVSSDFKPGHVRGESLDSELGLISESMIDHKHIQLMENDKLLQHQLDVQKKKEQIHESNGEMGSDAYHQLRGELFYNIYRKPYNTEEVGKQGKVGDTDAGDLEKVSKDPKSVARFFYFVEEVPAEPWSDDWTTSTNLDVLRKVEESLTIQRTDEKLPESIANVNLGIAEDYHVLKLHTVNNYSLMNLIKIKIFLKYNIIYESPDITGLYKIFFLTLLDENLIRHHYNDLVEFTKMFQYLYERYPVKVEMLYEFLDKLLNSFELYKTELTSSLYYERYGFQILDLMNRQLVSDLAIRLTMRFIEFEDLKSFWIDYVESMEEVVKGRGKEPHEGREDEQVGQNGKEPQNGQETQKDESNTIPIYRYHFSLRLLNYILQVYEYNPEEFPFIINQLTILKKCYQQLMQESSPFPHQYYLLNVLHEDYNYLSYYQIKFEKYATINKQDDFYRT